jgi:hypothetical protein
MLPLTYLNNFNALNGSKKKKLSKLLSFFIVVGKAKAQNDI